MVGVVDYYHLFLFHGHVLQERLPSIHHGQRRRKFFGGMRQRPGQARQTMGAKVILLRIVFVLVFLIIVCSLLLLLLLLFSLLSQLRLGFQHGLNDARPTQLSFVHEPGKNFGFHAPRGGMMRGPQRQLGDRMRLSNVPHGTVATSTTSSRSVVVVFGKMLRRIAQLKGHGQSFRVLSKGHLVGIVVVVVVAAAATGTTSTTATSRRTLGGGGGVMTVVHQSQNIVQGGPVIFRLHPHRCLFFPCPQRRFGQFHLEYAAFHLACIAVVALEADTAFAR